MRYARLLIMVLLAGCSRGGARPPGPQPIEDDLAAVPADLAAAPADLADDLAAVPADLAQADLKPSADLKPAPDLLQPPDLRSGILNVRIRVSNTCVVTTDPASYGVHAGETFTVNWINDGASAAPVDVAKIDMFNQVPIVRDLGPGMSYHDSVRPWCGLFTGTFSFRVTGCNQPYSMPIDCNLP